MPLSNNKEAHMSLSSGFVIFVLFVGFILFILLGCALGLIIPKIPSIAKKKMSKKENYHPKNLKQLPIMKQVMRLYVISY